MPARMEQFSLISVPSHFEFSLLIKSCFSLGFVLSKTDFSVFQCFWGFDLPTNQRNVGGFASKLCHT